MIKWGFTEEGFSIQTRQGRKTDFTSIGNKVLRMAKLRERCLEGEYEKDTQGDDGVRRHTQLMGLRQSIGSLDKLTIINTNDYERLSQYLLKGR